MSNKTIALQGLFFVAGISFIGVAFLFPQNQLLFAVFFCLGIFSWILVFFIKDSPKKRIEKKLDALINSEIRKNKLANPSARNVMFEPEPSWFAQQKELKNEKPELVAEVYEEIKKKRHAKHHMLWHRRS
jgi:hypothetical protein